MKPDFFKKIEDLNLFLDEENELCSDCPSGRCNNQIWAIKDGIQTLYEIHLSVFSNPADCGTPGCLYNYHVSISFDQSIKEQTFSTLDQMVIYLETNYTGFKCMEQ